MLEGQSWSGSIHLVSEVYLKKFVGEDFWIVAILANMGCSSTGGVYSRILP
jgi:hypothetical protein